MESESFETKLNDGKKHFGKKGKININFFGISRFGLKPTNFQMNFQIYLFIFSSLCGIF